jgi:sec-independent protein translocase protein TatC
MAASAPPELTPRQHAEEESGAAMSFFDHLVELRKRIISSLAAIGIGMVAGLAVSRRFINFISRPMWDALRANHIDPSLYFTHPAGYVSLYISIGLYLGIALAMPWVLYQVWLFVAPGLYKHERRAAASFIGSSMLLFVCGIAFGYYVMLPQVLTFVVAFATNGGSVVGAIKPLIDINEYFDLILVVLVGLGVIFELPVVVFILSLFGIVTPKFLLRNFRYALLLITVAAAIVTPTPDATTMLIFMAPMVVLYFVGVLVSYAVLRNKRARDLAERQAPSG